MTGRHRATAAEQRPELLALNPYLRTPLPYRGKRADTQRPVDVGLSLLDLPTYSNMKPPIYHVDSMFDPGHEVAPIASIPEHTLQRWLEVLDSLAIADGDIREVIWEIRDHLGLTNDDERTA